MFEAPATPVVPAWRLVAAAGALAVVNSLLFFVGQYAVVALLFTPPVGVLYLLAVLGATAALDASILWWATGRRAVVAGIASALFGAVLTALLFVYVVPTDSWLTGFSTVPIIAGVFSALAAGLAMPRRWARVLGAIALIGAISVIAVPVALADAARQREADAAAQVAADAALEQRVAGSTLPAIATAPGWSVWDVQPSDYVSIAHVVTADGGALRIDTVGESADTGRDALGCWMLVGDLGVFDETVTMDHYAGVCEEVAAGRWELADGSGLAVVHDSVLVLLTTVDPETAEAAGGTRPATTAELSDAADNLHVISRDELREYLLNSPVDPDGLGG